MVGRLNNPPRKPLKRSPKEPRKRSPEWLDWPRRQLGKGTMSGKMIQGRLVMKMGMASHQEDTTQGTTDDAWPAETRSEIGHDRFVRNSVESSTKENWFTAHQHTSPWIRG
jgi:hypothetical protein